MIGEGCYRSGSPRRQRYGMIYGAVVYHVLASDAGSAHNETHVKIFCVRACVVGESSLLFWEQQMVCYVGERQFR